MIREFKTHMPTIGKEVYIDDTAVITGRVTMAKGSSAYAFAAIRGDDNEVHIGENSNVQEHVTIHESLMFPTIVGNGVSIGHGAILHGCTIGNGVLIGMHATVLDGVVMGENCIVAAGSVCPPNKVYAANSMIMGSPAKVVRELRPTEIEMIRTNAKHYRYLSDIYLGQEKEQ